MVRKSTKSIIRKSLEKLAIGAVLLHASTQVAYWANDAYHAVRPSEVRASFKNEFGVPLRGWSADIEERRDVIDSIRGVLRIEQSEGPLHITAVRIESDKYLKKSLFEQIAGTFGTGYSGCFFRPTGGIILKPSANPETVHHEIKHAKAYALLRTRPEFHVRWRSLTESIAGKDGYDSLAWRICARTKGLQYLLRPQVRIREIPPSLVWAEGYEIDGFVSDYARTNIHEDIAELGEQAEWLKLSLRYPDIGRQSPAITDKFSLAEEYGLIPPGFSKFKEIQDIYFCMFDGPRGQLLRANAVEFLTASEEFLALYPKTRYEGELLAAQGMVLQQLASGDNERQMLESAVARFETALHLPDHDNNLLAIVDRLAVCHKALGNQEKASEYLNVYRMCVSR
ncbi:MAG TPA: hypothetical protein VJK52_00930 [Candidatus Nanoarchaeia archaeon]|nr:hypothetical protein [Candidatus Nanoarchaeia archaeon]